MLAECHTSINLLIDSITNQVLHQFESGGIYVSPNTRYIVVSRNPKSINVFYLQDDGKSNRVIVLSLASPTDI